MQIVTFNLRCCWDDVDKENTFVSRAGGILLKIEQEKPDVICFQEATDLNIAFLRKHLRDYYIIFNSRMPDLTGEGLAIAYNMEKAELFGLDVFWLSDTPDVPGSRFEIQSECPRVCQVALLKSESGKLFRICNVHLDHESDEARILATKQILKFFGKIDLSIPFFIMGDFNALPDSKTIKYFSEYKSIPIVDLTKDIEVSYHGFGTVCEKIDYIFTSTDTSSLTEGITVWNDEKNGRYLSDHYPITLKIDL